MGSRAPRKHPEIPGFRHTFNFLHRGWVTKDLNAIKSQRSRHLWSGAIVASHGAEIPNVCLYYREKRFEIGTEGLCVCIPHVMRTGTEPERWIDVVLVVTKHNFPFRAQNQHGVKPTIRKFG